MRRQAETLSLISLLCCLVGAIALFTLGFRFMDIMERDGGKISQKTIDDLRERLDKYKKAEVEKKKEIREKRQERESLEEELKRLQAALRFLVEEEEGLVRGTAEKEERSNSIKEEVEEITEELHARHRELEKLKKEMAETGKPEKEIKYKEEIDKRHALIKEMKKEVLKIQGAIARQERELREKRDTLYRMMKAKREEMEKRLKLLREKKVELTNIKDGIDVTSLFGECKAENILFIECKGEGIILQPVGRDFSKAQLEGEDRDLVNIIRKGWDQAYILIRPDGIPVFNKIKEIIKENNLKYGYEPVDEDWSLIYPEGRS